MRKTLSDSAAHFVQRSVLRFAYGALAFLEGQVVRDQKFMNLGLVTDDPVASRPEDEPERLQRQLYAYVTKRVALENKTVLEVGCGRGGGSHFIAEYGNPRSVTGIDFTKGNIKICRRLYARRNLTFQHGDAEDLKFPDGSFDVVLNVESSHHYPDMGRFVRGVHRVLKADGVFAFCDLGSRQRFDDIEALFSAGGFSIGHREDITPNVVRSIELDDARKLALIEHWPRLARNRTIRRLANNFAVMRDSDVYGRLKAGTWLYKHYLASKIGV